MKGPFRFALALGTVALLATGVALAECPVPFSFASSSGCLGAPGFEGFCLVESPNQDALATIAGDYWAVGFGDAAIGAGIDSGTCRATSCGNLMPAKEWLVPAGDFLAGIFGDWAVPARVDGCIDTIVGDQIMAALFSDAAGDAGYWAGATSSLRQITSPEFPFRDYGAQQNVTLVPIPKPSFLSNSFDSGSGLATVEMSAPDLGAGFYSDGAAPIGDVIAGWKLYLRRVSKDGTPPTGRGRGSWSEVDSGAVIPLDQGHTATVPCEVGTDAYLAISVVGVGGFETDYVSENSPLVQCGPTLATPPELPRLDRRTLPTRPTRKPRLRS